MTDIARNIAGLFVRDALSKHDVMELSPDDIAALRASVKRRTSLNAGRCWPVVMLVDGPLDGIRVKLTPEEARCDYVGFCHLTNRALAQVIYRRDTPTRYIFDSVHWPTAIAAQLG